MRSRDHAADGRAQHEQPVVVALAPAVRAAWYCAKRASAPVTRVCACSSAARASSSRFCGAAPAAPAARRVRGRASPAAGRRGFRLRLPDLRKLRWRRRRAAARAPVPAPRDTAVPGATRPRAPDGRRSAPRRRPRHPVAPRPRPARARSRARPLAHDGGPEVERPLLFLQEADVPAAPPARRRGRAAAWSRYTVTCADAMLVVESGPRARWRSGACRCAGVTSTPKMPGRTARPRGRLPTGATAIELDLDVRPRSAP